MRPSPAFALAACIVLATPAARAFPFTPPAISIGLRSARQDLGAWVIDFEVRNDSPAGVVVVPSDLAATIEGVVSNSRVPGHGLPRTSRIVLDGAGGPTAASELIAPTQGDPLGCKERAVLSIWSDDANPPAKPADGLAPVSLAPGSAGRLRIRIEHQHAIQGDYDPLLGVRTIALRVGEETFRDVAPLDAERCLARPKSSWPEPPEDRRDPGRFVSAPDSLHLAAHEPGKQYYRFPDRPVRYGSRMRLTFRYLIAAGTAGECRVRLSQYMDTPYTCRVLPDAGFDLELERTIHWTRVEKIVHVADRATEVALDFRISSEVAMGEMWVDDVRLEPIDRAQEGP